VAFISIWKTAIRVQVESHALLCSPGTQMSGHMSVRTLDHFHVQGQVSCHFESVREAFAENFLRRGELGGACCACHRGEKAFDLCGGTRNKRIGEPWERDTMVVVHSATKWACWPRFRGARS